MDRDRPAQCQERGQAHDHLAADAAAVASTVHRDGHYILVGHSYGGAVVTEVAPRIPNLERIVYVAALVPKEGQSATETARTVRVPTKLDEAIEVDGDYLRLNHNLASAALYNDCPRRSRVGPLTTLDADHREFPRQEDVPGHGRRFAVHTLHTRPSNHPLLQEHMADRCDIVFDLASDHPFFPSRRICEAILS